MSTAPPNRQHAATRRGRVHGAVALAVVLLVAALGWSPAAGARTRRRTTARPRGLASSGARRSSTGGRGADPRRAVRAAVRVRAAVGFWLLRLRLLSAEAAPRAALSSEISRLWGLGIVGVNPDQIPPHVPLGSKCIR